MMLTTLPLLAALVPAWAGTPIPAEKEEYAPLPFTPEQIRDATREGQKYTWIRQSKGEPTKAQVTEYLHVDPLGAEFRTSAGTLDCSEEGKPCKGIDLKVERQRLHTWKEIAEFAQYLVDITTIQNTTLETRAGTFDCVLYTTHTRSGDPRLMAWYSPQLPGVPIKLVDHLQGEVHFTLELVSVEGAPAPAEAGASTGK